MDIWLWKLNIRITIVFFTNTMFLRQAIDEARVQQGFTDAEVNDVR
jgi:hypothetical protein